MLSSLLFASGSSDDSSGGGGAAFQLVFFLAIGLLMYFLLIRPQRKRMREAQALVASIGEGDEIITTGGMYGFVTAVDGETVWLDVAEGVEIRLHRSSIARKVDPTSEPAGGPPADAAGDSSGDTPDADDATEK